MIQIKHMVKYNLKDIPINFCNDEESKIILQALGNKETGIQTYEIYEKFCSVIQNEMFTKLPKKTIVIRYGIQDKRRRIKKPWWNYDLQILYITA